MPRTKGAKNKISKDALERVRQTFVRVGGLPAFVRWAKENPTLFYRDIWAKTLPKKIEGEMVHSMRRIEDMSANELRALLGLGEGEGPSPAEVARNSDPEPHSTH